MRSARSDRAADPGPLHHLRDAIGVLVGRLELAYLATEPEQVKRHLQRALKAEEKVMDRLADMERAWRAQRRPR